MKQSKSKVSKLYLSTTMMTLNTIFKVSDAEIRVHGLDNIPDQPVLYVINHFTRMETFFLPSVIHKYTKRYSISLAHHSFFGGGGLGKFLEKLAAVSTHDPDRDKKLTSALLAGDMSVIIFPEGQMLKDKKIIEKGKYMVFNAGIRRPPHTGAARLALTTQFYREKIKYFHENGNIDEINKYKKHFDFDDNKIESIIKNDTLIIPVNVSYYPIRSKSNTLTKLTDKFIKKIPDRVQEELEVEGTMLFEGVDIDINFGEPINAKKYLTKSSNCRKKIKDKNLYIKKAEIKKALPLRKVSVDFMYEYMESIYKMTTINLDHVFSYLLTTNPKHLIIENNFKKKAYLAIEKIKQMNLTNHHSSLDKNQYHLLTDDEHEKYNSFIDAAISDGLITIKDGYIIKNKGKFNKLYSFHTIRKDNIIEIFKNEIEPLEDVTKILNKIVILSPRLVRRRIRKKFIELDQEVFENDYKEFYIAGESKPKNIGRPFLLKKRFSNKRGIILIHGYMAAPEEVRVVADYLFKKGYTVYGARLKGHGTAPEDLAIRNWEDWYNSVNRAYIIMNNFVRDLAICGFSTGAGLALLQASTKGNIFKGVISINAPLKLQNISSHLSSAVVVWNKLLKKINVKKGKMEFITNSPENPHINYYRNPISGVRELGKLMNIVEDKLKDINIPSLIIQGSNDPVVNPISSLDVFDKIGTEDKEVYRIFSNRHGIVRGAESKKVLARIDEFLKDVCN